MADKEIIKKVKYSSIAVGLVKRNELNPLAIFGSGFIIDKSGIIATAEHVFAACKIAKQFLKSKKNITADTAIFRSVPHVSGIFLDAAVITDLKKITYVNKKANFPLTIIDLGFGKMVKPISDCVPLEIDSKLPDITDEIAVCGFPSGDFTFDLEGKRMGLRYSPLFQRGNISGFMPYDDAPEPYGIQTDIIGVGGSSGSPIINSTNGKVIGIAQQVILATTEVETAIKIDEQESKTYSGFGYAKVGQVYGLSNIVLNPIVKQVLNYYKTGKIDDFKIKASGLDFAPPIIDTVPASEIDP